MASVFQDCFRRIFSYTGVGGDGPDPGGPTDPDDCEDGDPTCCVGNENDPDCSDDGGGDDTDECAQNYQYTSCGTYCNATDCCDGPTTTINLTAQQLKAAGFIQDCLDTPPQCLRPWTDGNDYGLGTACVSQCCPSQACGYFECLLSDGNGCSNEVTFECCEPASPSQPGFPNQFRPADEPCQNPDPSRYFEDEESCIPTCTNSDSGCVYYFCEATEQTVAGSRCVPELLAITTLREVDNPDGTTCDDFSDVVVYDEVTYYSNPATCSETFPCCPIPVLYSCEPEDPYETCGNCISVLQEGSCEAEPTDDAPFSTLSECEDECNEAEKVWMCFEPELGYCGTTTICKTDDNEGLEYFDESGECNAQANNGVGCCVPRVYWYCPIPLDDPGSHNSGNVACVSYTDDDCGPDTGAPNGSPVYQTKEACERSQFTYCCPPFGSDFDDNWTNADCELNDGQCAETGECATPLNDGVVFNNQMDCAQATPNCSNCYDEAGQDVLLQQLFSSRLENPVTQQLLFNDYFCEGEPSPRLQPQGIRNVLGQLEANPPVYNNFSDFSLSINGSPVTTSIDGINLTWTLPVNLDQQTDYTYELFDQCNNLVASVTVTRLPNECTLPANVEMCQYLNSLNAEGNHPYKYPCVDSVTADPFDDPPTETGTGVTFETDNNRVTGSSDDPGLDPGIDSSTRPTPTGEGSQASFNEGADYLRDMNNVIETDKLFDVLGNDTFVRYSGSKFTPIPNDKHLNILAPQIHASIWAIMNIGREPLATERAFDDVSLNYIYRSLNSDLRAQIDKLVDFDGQPLSRKILRRIRRFLFEGRLDDFDPTGLINIDASHPEQERKSNIANQNSIISLVNQKAKPLDYKAYGHGTKERMRLWKTVSTDLDKAIPYVDADSVVHFIDIKQDDSYKFLDSSGGELETKYINEGDFITYYKSSGDRGFLDLDTLLDKAVMFDLEDARQAFAFANDDYNTVLTVSSDEGSLVEENYSLSTPRDTFYFFKLELSTLEDQPRTNPLIRKSKATFKLITDPDEINEWIEYKAWPYMHFNIESDDPFIDHMLDTSTMVAEFKDISFDKFQASTDDVPIIPRRIPWHIVLIPTDRTRFLIGSGRSKLTGYNTRKATFRLSPDKKQIRQRWDSDIFNTDEVDYFEGIDPRVEQKTFKVTYDSSKFNTVKRSYQSGVEKLPRKPSAARQLFKAIRTAKEDETNFIDESKTKIEWASVFKNLSANERKSLNRDIENFNKRRDEIATNTFAKTEAVRERFVEITEVFDTNLKNVDDYTPPPAKKRERSVSIEEPEGGAETPEIVP